MRASAICRHGSAAVLLTGLFLACGEPPPPIEIQRNFVRVDNRTAQDWLDVEIWLNRQYRVTVPRVAARTRFTTTLDVFVAGFGQRFDYHRQRIDDLRLKAHTSDGTSVDIRFDPPKSGLAGALRGFHPRSTLDSTQPTR
jgi:hypothetical protein